MQVVGQKMQVIEQNQASHGPKNASYQLKKCNSSTKSMQDQMTCSYLQMNASRRPKNASHRTKPSKSWTKKMQVIN